MDEIILDYMGPKSNDGCSINDRNEEDTETDTEKKAMWNGHRSKDWSDVSTSQRMSGIASSYQKVEVARKILPYSLWRAHGIADFLTL